MRIDDQIGSIRLAHAMEFHVHSVAHGVSIMSIRNSRVSWIISFSPAAALCALLCLSMLGKAHARESHASSQNWNTESLEFVNDTGSFNCSGCHSPNLENTDLVVEAPDSVPFDATSAVVTLKGFNSTGGKSFLRYKSSGAAQQLSLPRSNNDLIRNIEFAINSDPVVVRYCMLDAAGSSGSSGRRWNCDEIVMDRDPESSEPPITPPVIPPITVPIPGRTMVPSVAPPATPPQPPARLPAA